MNPIYLNFVETAVPDTSHACGPKPRVNVEGVAILIHGAPPHYRRDWQSAIAELQVRYGQQLEQAEVVVWNALHAGAILAACGIRQPMLTDVRWLGRYVFSIRPYESLSELYTRCGGMPLPSAETVGAETFVLSTVRALCYIAGQLFKCLPAQELAAIRHTAAIAQSAIILVDVVALKQLLQPALKKQYPHLYSFIERVLSYTDSNGRLHMWLDYNKAGTGRFSVAKRCVIHGIPRQPAATDPAYSVVTAILSAIHSPPGYCFVTADAQAIEPRVFAFLAGEEQLYADLIGGIDIYSKLAGAVFGNSGIAAGTLRQIAKRAFLGFCYGIGADTLYEGLTDEPELRAMVERGIITFDSCARLLGQLKADYPRLTEYGRTLEDAVRNAYASGTAMFETLKVTFYAGGTMVIMLPSGRQLSYYGFAIGADGVITYVSAGGETKKLYSSKLAQNLIQGVARDLLVNALSSVEYNLVYHIHDEIVCCVPELEIDTCRQMLQTAWCTPPAWLPGFQLAVEVKVGRNLAEMMKITGSDELAGT